MAIDIRKFMEENYNRNDFSHLHWSGSFHWSRKKWQPAQGVIGGISPR
jgi:hypothetical protein